jgi:acetate kinase
MATRAGSIDPGIVTWLITEGGLDARAVTEGLERDSGLVGLCGTADMRAVIARRDAGEPDASLAFDVYTHALRRALGAMSAVLGDVDLVAFTGGVGEHASLVRAHCGLTLDEAANRTTTRDGEITAPDASPRVFVVTAREDLEIARAVRAMRGRTTRSQGTTGG